MQSSNNEFRQRQGGNVQGGGGHARSGSQSSLPRPVYSAGSGAPRPSPNATRRANSGGGHGVPAPPLPGQRSNSFSSQGSSPAARPAYNSSAYNPNNGGSQYGGSSSNGNYGGYGSSSNGLSSGSGHSSRGLGNDNKYSKKRKAGSSGWGIATVVWGVILFVYAIMITVLYFGKDAQTKSMLTRVDLPDTLAVAQKVEELERRLKNSETTRRNAEASSQRKYTNQINRLERANKLAKVEADEANNVHLPAADEKIDHFTNREAAFMDQVGWLMDHTRRESKRLVLERFGPGPHKIEVTYAVDENNGNGEKRRYSFVIDLAPLEVVPHAVHLFLEQVDHGLLEGTHFYLNGPHIVQAGPQPDWNEIDATDDVFQKSVEQERKLVSNSAVDTLTKYDQQVAKKKSGQKINDDDEYEEYYTQEQYFEEDKRTRKFANLGLEQLAFPDYNDEHPHLPWTVGYTGRPGGPDWYINKVDNSKGHGPGGQSQHLLDEQGDSCFGTISIEGDGRDMLVRHIYHSEIYNDNSEWHSFVSSPIEIVGARILTKNPILDRHLHLDHLHSQHKVYDYRRKKVTHGDGVNPDELPQRVQEMVQDGKEYTINKVEHPKQRPHILQSAEA